MWSDPLEWYEFIRFAQIDSDRTFCDGKKVENLKCIVHRP